MKYIPITKETLSDMQEILNLSAGYNVSLEDEIEYFDPEIAKSWVLATDDSNQQIGFIRYFKQGDDWSLAELYVKPNRPDRKNIAIALLKEFKDKISFKKGHRLRFDVLKSDNEINNAIESMGLSQNRQYFLHFEYNLKDYAGNKENIETEFDSEEVAEVLSHLSPVSISEVQHWINDKKIRGVFNQERLACAAYLLESDETIEISRIATHSNFLRQGFARKLIRELLDEAKQYNKEKVYLKVDQIKNPAISLYKSIGFKELEEKNQIWHSSYF